VSANEWVGYLIVANIGTIITVAIGVARLIWFLSKLHSKLEETSGDVDAAHAKIRDLEKLFIERGI
jgi:hypothetical protein